MRVRADNKTYRPDILQPPVLFRIVPKENKMKPACSTLGQTVLRRTHKAVPPVRVPPARLGQHTGRTPSPSQQGRAAERRKLLEYRKLCFSGLHMEHRHQTLQLSPPAGPPRPVRTGASHRNGTSRTDIEKPPSPKNEGHRTDIEKQSLVFRCHSTFRCPQETSSQPPRTPKPSPKRHVHSSGSKATTLMALSRAVPATRNPAGWGLTAQGALQRKSGSGVGAGSQDHLQTCWIC